MRKTTKGKEGKIPRLTEAEYAEYISSLKIADNEMRTVAGEEKVPSQPSQNSKEK